MYTPFLNARGTYEADLTVTRTGPISFLLVSSSATTVRDLDWLARHGVPARDVTEEYAVLGVMGPRSRSLLGALSDDDWSEDGFPFATSGEVTVAGERLRATRMTYVGELGWELMVPVGSAVAVYDAIAAGGATDAGYYAIESLRLEKGYRAFGRELTPDYGPVEAGLVFATARQRHEGLPRPGCAGEASGGPGRRWTSTPTGVARGRVAGADALGRRAAPARRRSDRAGHQRRLGRDASDRASDSATCVTTDRSRRLARRRQPSRSTSRGSGTSYVRH